MKKKYALEFEHKPVLVFIHEKEGEPFKVFKDGEEVLGVRSVRIISDFDDRTTYVIERRA